MRRGRSDVSRFDTRRAVCKHRVFGGVNSVGLTPAQSLSGLNPASLVTQ
jgi:hypothetical protein